MELERLLLSKKQILSLNNKGIHTVEELLRFFPLRYNDCSKVTGILPSDQLSCVTAILKRTKKYDNKYHTITSSLLLDNGQEIKVTWFNMPYLFSQIKALTNRKVYVCGKFTLDDYTKLPETVNPIVFSADIKGNMKIFPVYSNINGMGKAMINAAITNALNTCQIKDYYSDEFREKFDLIPLYQAIYEQHFPCSMEKNRKSMERFLFDDMLYFTLMEKKINEEISCRSDFIVHNTEVLQKVIQNLPYKLTLDQKAVLEAVLEKMKSGARANGLIQGDVSCGKSIVCFLLAIVMAENGYQTAIMAPSKIVALQHYEELCKLVDAMDIGIDYLISTGDMPAKQKKAVIQRIKSGTTKIVVGTSSLISDIVEYNCLGLAIVDEEHKFGVLQRKNLVDKGLQGVHTLIMSATPIPRTLAKTIYNNNTDLFTIKSMPNGRKRIKSCVTNAQPATIGFLLRELASGHQAYIVCPMIEKNKKVKGVLSAEELFGLYRPILKANNFEVKMITGKMKKADSDKIFEEFKRNEVQVLIATSVIEVGVNVPNATVIIIHNAERFGMAGLHQLRGRVGRGSEQAYCIFFSDEKDNPRLDVLLHTTNGFEIAEKDLLMREPGDMLRGIRQSGKNKYIDLILANKDQYQVVKDAVSYLESIGEAEKCLKRMMQSFYKDEA